MSTQITESLSLAIQQMALDVSHLNEVIALINSRTDTPRLYDGPHTWIVLELVHNLDEKAKEHEFTTFAQAFECWLNLVTGNNPGADNGYVAGAICPLCGGVGDTRETVKHGRSCPAWHS